MTATGGTKIIGTAGHIDHGKTSLVKALTGVDLDATPEETERGITISLGFTSLTLPNGEVVALIDVPGHERLVRTMVSGATGIDGVLLVISAQDGVMPQTVEHLSILQLLGVTNGIVVLTMADLVDDEMLELAAAEVEDLLQDTPLEGAPCIPFSAVTGVGQADLLHAIEQLPINKRPSQHQFRMPIDRTFVQSGFGSVATGTVWSGTLKEGETVTLLPSGQSARVRALQQHGAPTKSVGAGQRAAINLSGIERSELPRGTVITTGDVPCCQMIDARYQHIKGATPLVDGAEVRVLHGTSEHIAKVYIVSEMDIIEPEDEVWVQLRLREPLPALPGDRFILRRPSPQITLGGGQIVDCWPPRLRKRNRDRCSRELTDLMAGDETVWLERAGESGLSVEDWQARAPACTDGVPMGGRIFGPKTADRLKTHLLESLGEYHRKHPLSPGAGRRELHRGRLAHLDRRVFDDLIKGLEDAKDVITQGPLLRLIEFQVTLSPAQQQTKKQLMDHLDSAGVEGATLKTLQEGRSPEEAHSLLRLLTMEESVQPIAGIGFVATTHTNAIIAILEEHFANHQTLSPGDFKALSGLTRKRAIPLLEWLDEKKFTIRTAEGRARFK